MIRGFTQLFTSGHPQTPVDAAKKMASIYDQYAQLAMAGPSLPAFTGLEKGRLESLLLAALAVPLVGAPPLIAAAWANGMLAYWNTPPVPFVGPAVAGAVTLAVGCLSAIAPLTVVFSNPFNTPESAAVQIASALDIATRTVIVTIAPPPGTIVPLV